MLFVCYLFVIRLLFAFCLLLLGRFDRSGSDQPAGCVSHFDVIQVSHIIRVNFCTMCLADRSKSRNYR